METSIHKNDKIITADGKLLGYADILHRQPDDSQVDPDLRLFRFYLKVVNLSVGDDFYVPTNYIAEYGANEHKLSLTLEEVQDQTLTREPQFIAFGKSEEIKLNDSGQS